MISFAKMTGTLVSGLLAVAVSLPAEAQTVTFNIDGNAQLIPVKINASGVVAGWYGKVHAPNQPFQDFFGFVRSATGEITTFAIPSIAPYTSATFVYDMNDAGTLVGDGYCEGTTCRGYLRDSAGKLTLIDVPASTNVSPRAINNAGTVAGSWFDASFSVHGFIRDSAGVVTTFDAPGPSNSINSFQTIPVVINDRGDVAGTSIDDISASAPADKGIFHIFLRRANGVFTRFEIPGNGAITVSNLDNNGRITGVAVGTNGVPQSFTISSVGKLILTLLGGRNSVFSIDYPGALYTQASDANNARTVVGTYNGSDFVAHGFMRNSRGVFSSFDIDGGVDTVPTSVNEGDVVTGTYRDTNLVYHGFIRHSPSN